MIPSLQKCAEFGMNTHDASITIWLPFVPIFVVIKITADTASFGLIGMPTRALHLTGIPLPLHPGR